MQITIYTKTKSLEELANFLSTDIPYEHNIPIYKNSLLGVLSFSYTKVSLFYDDYVRLMDFKLLLHRTEDKGPL
jgi:hypothetical protein